MRMTRQGAFPIMLATLMLSHAGCGEESSSGGGDNGGDSGGDNGGGTTTGGNGGEANGGNGGETSGGNGGSTTTGGALLGPDTAGAACKQDADCGPSGTCVLELTGGSLSMVGVEPVAAPGGYCSATCASADECGDGGACFGALPAVGGGECRAGCESNSDCREGYECAMLNGDVGFPVASTCQPLPVVTALADDEAGKLCTSDADCPNGRCNDSGLCTGDCVKDADCGAGGVCLPGLYGSLGGCAEGCATNDDCQNAAAGYGCSSGEPKLCVTRLVEGAVGMACTAANEATVCAGGECRESSRGTDYPGGYCVGSCDVDADCGTGGVCINSTTCLQGCADASECRDGYECVVHPLADETSTATICFPKAGEEATTDGGTGTVDGGN